jgi:hypothetical protein
MPANAVKKLQLLRQNNTLLYLIYGLLETASLVFYNLLCWNKQSVLISHCDVFYLNCFPGPFVIGFAELSKNLKT